MASPTFQFRTDLFDIDPREDEETNPFCYGRSLAEWVRSKFEGIGYAPEPVIPEDWGWCVMLQREPFLLWIACGNDRSEFYDKVTPEQKASFVPDGRHVVWSCFVGADAPPWTSFFWKKLLRRASMEERTAAVNRQLRGILSSEPRIRLAQNEEAAELVGGLGHVEARRRGAPLDILHLAAPCRNVPVTFALYRR